MRLRRIAPALAALAAAALAGPAAAQDSPINIGTVQARQFSPATVAVPAFEKLAGALDSPRLEEVVARDLFLSGFFQPPANPQFAAETHAMDQQKGQIHFAEWHRAGVAYVVKGKYTLNGDALEAEVRTYDATAGTYIFGKKYIQYRKGEARSLAHRAANDVIKRVTGYDGTANAKIAFIRDMGRVKDQVVKEVFVMDADGNGPVQMTRDNSLNATPAWGARGTELYYTTYKDYNPDLAGVFLDRSYTWFISRRAGFNLSPDWSEKKQMIALTLSKDGNSEIYVVSREGKGLSRLTVHRNIDSSPCWSPDGSQIAFTSDRDGGPQIYIMDASGVNVRRFSRTGSYNDGASWSPDGKHIAYSSRVNGIFQVYVADVATGAATQITSGGYDNEDPCWSPNGATIVFTSTRSGSKQVHVMFADGRHLAQLSSGRPSFSPDWSPSFP